MNMSDRLPFFWKGSPCMKNIIFTLILVVFASLSLPHAVHAGEKNKEVATAQKEVNSLKKEIRTLSKELKTKKTENPQGTFTEEEKQLKALKADMKSKRQELQKLQQKTAKEEKEKKEEVTPKAKKKNAPKATSNKLTEPKVKYPGNLSLKDGTTLNKVTVNKVSASKIIVSDNKMADRVVMVKDLTPESKSKLEL